MEIIGGEGKRREGKRREGRGKEKAILKRAEIWLIPLEHVLLCVVDENLLTPQGQNYDLMWSKQKENIWEAKGNISSSRKLSWA